MRYRRLEDWAEWARLREASRDHLTPWEPAWSADALSEAAFRRRIADDRAKIKSGKLYPFFLFERETGELLGGLNVRRQVNRSSRYCTFGYWTGAPHAGRGYMTDAVKAALDFAFDELDVHRVEAVCIPDNESSRGVLVKNGFHEEGLMRGYLKINGAWRDHLRYGILNSDRGN